MHERPGRERQSLSDSLIQRCRRRIEKYQELEDWLTQVQQSDFDAETIATIRGLAREERLLAITRQVHDEMYTQAGDQYAGFKPVLDILSELNLQDESVYDSVLFACDTGEPEALETALATVRYCQARAEEALRAVPEAMALQRRLRFENELLGTTFRTGCLGTVVGGMAGMLACVGVCANSNFDAGFLTFVVCSLIGGGLGVFIGYKK